MDSEPTPQELSRFLSRVIEIEEKYAYTRKGQESSRKGELRSLVEEILEE